jgi:hypothetical protein
MTNYMFILVMFVVGFLGGRYFDEIRTFVNAIREKEFKK